MVVVDSRNVNFIVINDFVNIFFLFVGIILTYVDMVLYIYGKWVYMWGGSGDCFFKCIFFGGCDLLCGYSSCWVLIWFFFI